MSEAFIVPPQLVALTDSANSDAIVEPGDSTNRSVRVNIVAPIGGGGGVGTGVPVEIVNASSTSTSAARTVVTTSVVVQLLAANTSRKQFLVQNADILPIHLVFGAGNPSVAIHHVTLKACTNANDGTGGSFISDLWKGAVRAIAQQVVLVTSGAVVVTEFT